MSIKDIAPPVKSSDSGDSNWSQLLNWLSLLWKFVRTPALVVTNGNVPTAPTGTPGDTSTQIATDAFVANAVTTAVSTATNSSLAAMAAFAGGDGGQQILYGQWNTFTPVLSASSGTITAYSGTIRWVLLNKTVTFSCNMTITTNGTAAGYLILTLPLPFVGGSSPCGAGRENAFTGKSLNWATFSSSSLAFVYYDNTYPGANGANLLLSGSYETS